eukprot:7382718-Prymnesium_polylepis.2
MPGSVASCRLQSCSSAAARRHRPWCSSRPNGLAESRAQSVPSCCPRGSTSSRWLARQTHARASVCPSRQSSVAFR